MRSLKTRKNKEKRCHLLNKVYIKASAGWQHATEVKPLFEYWLGEITLVALVVRSLQTERIPSCSILKFFLILSEGRRMIIEGHFCQMYILCRYKACDTSLNTSQNGNTFDPLSTKR